MKNKSPPTYRQGPGPGISANSSPPQKLVDLSQANRPNSILSPSSGKNGTTQAGTGRSTNNSTGLGFILASPKGSTKNSSPANAWMRQQKVGGAFATKPNITSQASTTSLLKMSVSTKMLPRTNSSGHVVASQQKPNKPGIASYRISKPLAGTKQTH